MADWYATNFKSKGHMEGFQGSTLPYLLELHRIDGIAKLKVRRTQVVFVSKHIYPKRWFFNSTSLKTEGHDLFKAIKGTPCLRTYLSL